MIHCYATIPAMNQTCATCNTGFEINSADEEYYKRREVPHPKNCPKCRLQRRLAWRNERKLFKRKCDKSGKDIISNLRPDAPVPVYHTDEWFKDDWQAPMLPNFDFNRPFLDQWKELSRVAPRMHKATGGNELNSEYSNHCGNCKNCYYIFNSEYDEDCLYLRFSDKCTDCTDSTNILNSQLCYECVNVENCYHLFFSDDCKQCRDSLFLRYCRGTQNSIFCYGLDKKDYNIYNEQRSKEDFMQLLQQLRLDTHTGMEDAKKKWEEWSTKFPKTREIVLNCENSTGDSLYNSKNAHDSYNCTELEDCRYVLNAVRVKDSYDYYAWGESELCHETVTMMGSYDCKFCVYTINCDNMEYSDTCRNVHYGFGCIGLKSKSYCIFNKQYTKEEYEEMVPRIREKMKQEGVYGEFFPMEMSFFPYEDTLAQDYFPKDVPPPQLKEGEFKETSTLPDALNDTNFEDVLKTGYKCPSTEQPFRYQKQELDFYKKMGLALPRESFEARYAKRNELIPFPY